MAVLAGVLGKGGHPRANSTVPAGESHEILCHAKLCGRGEDAQQGSNGGPDA